MPNCRQCGQPMTAYTTTQLCANCQQPQPAFNPHGTPCQQCGLPLDNTGTICNTCLQNVMQAKGFKGLVQATAAQRKTALHPPQPARPILLGKGQPVATTTSTTYVEFKLTVLVGVDPGSGIAEVIVPPNAEQTATGNYFARDGAGNLVTAGVPEPPPKFSSPEEADEWLEANAGRARSFDVEITQDQATVALHAAQNCNIHDWL